MTYTPITGTLGYLWDKATDQVLMVHRTARADDQSLGKWNGLGGKLEANEDVATCMIRELQEEACVEVNAMRLRATISWPGFGPNGEDWLGFVFVVDSWTVSTPSGLVPERNPEGSLRWVDRERLIAACSDTPATANAADLPMWEGDKYFVPLLFDDDPRLLYGVMPYSEGRPSSWSFVRM